jgi:hypothetical protein
MVETAEGQSQSPEKMEEWVYVWMMQFPTYSYFLKVVILCP